MLLDTGASISSIAPWLANRLIASGEARELAPIRVGMANGSTVMQRVVSVSTLTIGSHTGTNVPMAVTDGEDMLLGLPVLNAIGKFSIDAVSGQLTFG